MCIEADLIICKKVIRKIIDHNLYKSLEYICYIRLKHNQIIQPQSTVVVASQIIFKEPIRDYALRIHHARLAHIRMNQYDNYHNIRFLHSNFNGRLSIDLTNEGFDMVKIPSGTILGQLIFTPCHQNLVKSSIDENTMYN